MAGILYQPSPENHLSYNMEQEEKKVKEEETVEKKQKPAKQAKAEKTAELQKEIDELNEKLAASEDSIKKEKDDYLRLMAEFDNYRRRTSQEKLDLVSVASKDIIEGLLPVLDDCERALAMLKEDDESRKGVELIFNKLMGYLQSKGLAVIEAKDLEFNTDFHEAVAQFPVQEEDKKGKVFDTAQTGYTLNGKVIRYAKVVVGI